MRLNHVSDDGERWSVALVQVEGREPVLRITGPAMRNTPMDYLVTTAMECVLSGKGFVFGWGESLFRFGPVAIAHVVNEVVARTPETAGEYVVYWRAADSTFPL
ncbi:MAG: hypothetical protein I8H71_00880 [Xanthomonadaceae bacterium]|nr:hypothetical protein [Xanthomonadaceae bacterium]